jgi:hypothetical protein
LHLYITGTQLREAAELCAAVVQTFGRIFVIPVSEREREEQRRRKVAVLYIIKKICMHKTEHFILLANPAERKNSAKVDVARKMISDLFLQRNFI